MKLGAANQINCYNIWQYVIGRMKEGSDGIGQ